MLVVVPFPFAHGDGRLGLARAAPRARPQGGWSLLFTLRIGTEAVTNSAPAGAVWADAISPLLVSQRTGIPAVDVFAASTAKRWTVVRMHAAYVSLSAAFGATALLHASRTLFKSDMLLVATLGAAVFLMFLSIAIEALAARGQGRRSHLGDARKGRSSCGSERGSRSAVTTSRAPTCSSTRLSKNKRAGATAAWRMLGLWLFEGLESYLILRLLGAPLGLDRGPVVRRGAVRRALVARCSRPRGSASRTSAISRCSRPTACPTRPRSGPAFIVLKRVKEAFWIAIGFVMLARPGPRALLLHPERCRGRGSVGAAGPARGHVDVNAEGVGGKREDAVRDVDLRAGDDVDERSLGAPGGSFTSAASEGLRESTTIAAPCDVALDLAGEHEALGVGHERAERATTERRRSRRARARPCARARGSRPATASSEDSAGITRRESGSFLPASPTSSP